MLCTMLNTEDKRKNEQCTIASVSSPPAILLRPLSNQKSTRWTDGRLEPSKDLGTVKYYLSSQKNLWLVVKKFVHNISDLKPLG